MGLNAMPSRLIAIALLSAAAAGLSACGQTQPVDTSSEPAAQDTASTVPASTVPAIPSQSPPASSTSVLPKAVPPSTSRDPQEVLLSWAKAISLKDWATAYGYWGDRGARSGQTLEQFTAAWSKLKQPDLEIGKGEQEGAAGSLFYTVPVTIVDGTRRIPGEVVLRRVNDVDGATAEQLRWHIESTTLKP